MRHHMTSPPLISKRVALLFSLCNEGGSIVSPFKQQSSLAWFQSWFLIKWQGTTSIFDTNHSSCWWGQSLRSRCGLPYPSILRTVEDNNTNNIVAEFGRQKTQLAHSSTQQQTDISSASFREIITYHLGTRLLTSQHCSCSVQTLSYQSLL